ncbi:MAG TPA: hypothetical protein DCF68_08470 [Cyanothece sp. UBA12306]|nr:hypothetical protein [Cyanothece sp. UBA12306]
MLVSNGISNNLLFNYLLTEQILLIEELEDQLETLNLMKLAEIGFQEWYDPEEDIYNYFLYSIS